MKKGQRTFRQQSDAFEALYDEMKAKGAAGRGPHRIRWGVVTDGDGHRIGYIYRVGPGRGVWAYRTRYEERPRARWNPVAHMIEATVRGTPAGRSTSDRKKS